MDELFTQAPEEVVRYFESKGQKPSFDWRDVAPAEHAHTFTVAKSAGYDVLDDLRRAVDDAVRNQISFEEFSKNLTPVLQEKGWWGKKVATDPADGQFKIVQLGSPRRLRTIYWANTATARAAGEWERTQANKNFLPLLRYGRSTSENRRLQHAGWEGTILPVDHPFWETHYPPNGWGCECPVRQLSTGQAKREGYDPDAAPPEITTRTWLNRRTGQREDVPVGIDPGWAQNPGKSRRRNATEILAGRIDRLPLPARGPAIADYLASPAFTKLRDDALAQGAARQTAVANAKASGITDASALRAIADKAAPVPQGRFAVAVVPTRFDSGSPVAFLDSETISHKGKRLKEANLRKTLYARIQSALLYGTAKRAGDRIRIYDATEGLFVVLEKGDGHWRVVTAYPRTSDKGYMDRQEGDWVD